MPLRSIWRRARAACAMSTAVAALALAPPAAAGGARTVDARYTVSWLGFPVYSAHMLGRIDGGQYSLRFSAWGEGVVRVSGGTTIAWETNGRVTPDGFVPATFLQSNTWRKQTRRITTSFNGKGVPAVSVEPPESPGKRPLVPDALKLGTVDPLTAVLASLAQPASRRDCRFEARVFEGLRRTDIRFELAGIERTPPTGVAGLSLESGLCLMHARRVAGYEDRSFKNAPDPLPPAKIWVAYHAASASWIPVQLRFESRYGPIYARLTRLDAARAAP